MENLSLIAAIGPNRELGYNNKLIWHIKEDLAFYKQMTMHKNIIMGRSTLETMPKVALIGRKPIILTHNNIAPTDLIKYYNNIETLLQIIKASQEEFMVVGGATIYNQFLPFIDTMYLTHIQDTIIQKADCYFPSFEDTDWNIQDLKEGKDANVSYQIKKYIRKK